MKKIITLLSLLFLLASCWVTKKVEDTTNTGTVNVKVNDEIVVGTATGENEQISIEVVATWSLDEQQVLSDDIDNLLNDIIKAAENE
jgi:hypothetical protein